MNISNYYWYFSGVLTPKFCDEVIQYAKSQKEVMARTGSYGDRKLKKEEVLECKDGYDGPNYWELFAQFYYSGITVPPYCRQYARPDHPFKTPGMICLSEAGVWEVQ